MAQTNRYSFVSTLFITCHAFKRPVHVEIMCILAEIKHAALSNLCLQIRNMYFLCSINYLFSLFLEAV